MGQRSGLISCQPYYLILVHARKKILTDRSLSLCMIQTAKFLESFKQATQFSRKPINSFAITWRDSAEYSTNSQHSPQQEESFHLPYPSDMHSRVSTK